MNANSLQNLTYDLDNLNTIRRSTRFWFKDVHETKLWEEGCVETSGWTSPYYKTVEPWRREDQERLAQDPDVVNLEPRSAWLQG